ncbi:hypothetical protein D3C75_1165900 [compost metagenome]
MDSPRSPTVMCLYSAPGRTSRSEGNSPRPTRWAILKSLSWPSLTHCSKVSSDSSQPCSTDLLATSSRMLPKSLLEWVKAMPTICMGL